MLVHLDLQGSLDGQVGSLTKALIFPDYLRTEEEAEVSTLWGRQPQEATLWDEPPREGCVAEMASAHGVLKAAAGLS